MRGPDGRSAGVGITLAGIMLTLASCASHPTAAPTPTATVLRMRHLGSPIVLEAVLSQPPSPAGGCPSGSAALSGPGAGPPGQCYRPLGKPVTFASAVVSSYQQTNSPGQAAGPSGVSGLLITVPPADVAALTAVTTRAAGSRGYIDIIVAGKTWGIP